MYKSNINIVSNIYIRNPRSFVDGFDDLQRDPEFVAHVSGQNALKIIKNKYSGTLSSVRLSPVQEKELQESSSCIHAPKGEKSFGKVLKNGEYFYECRCEAKDCFICTPKKINRSEITVTEEDDDGVVELEWLGIKGNTDVFAEPDFESNSNEEFVPDEAVIRIEDIVTDRAEYVEIDEIQAIDAIIETDLNSHILVNAGPGTGKTYTAIQRLLYILKNTSPENCDAILVLCYTRAAVAEIKMRIQEGIKAGIIPYEANQVNICTFDSIATNYLITIGVSLDELSKLDYNQRICLFNEKINSEDFEDFVYCIVDELQDLVNDRALMMLNILNALCCGYLLLGDKCQAIYDYDCTGERSINSTEFYKCLGEILPDDTKKYELTGNKRQSQFLNEQTTELRSSLLNFDPGNITAVFRKMLLDLPAIVSAEKFSKNNISEEETTAILCRNNGEAEYMSTLLHSKKIPHTLVRNIGQDMSLNRCIADVLWDYADKIMSKDEFTKRLFVRCNFTEKQADGFYNSLTEFLSEITSGYAYDYIDREKLAEILCQKIDFPETIRNENNNHLIVSTIHKAKGREFDKVYLLGYDYNPDYKKDESDTEEERILYVAETRPKKELEILKKGKKYDWYFLKSNCNRWIRTIKVPYKNPFCAGFATGLLNDIDYSSFVSGNLIEAVTRQEYIANNVKAEDEIYLKLNSGDRYYIIHNDIVIGEMTREYSDNLREKFGGRRFISNRLPDKISNLYITNVITYVSNKNYENIPQIFRNNRFWLGVEISGFGRTEWTEI